MLKYYDITAQPEYDAQFWAEMKTKATDNAVIAKAASDITGGYRFPSTSETIAMESVFRKISTNINDATNDTILGKPVVVSEYMPYIEAGEKPVAFGDFYYYWIADRDPASVQITSYAKEHASEFVEMVANKSQAEISKNQRDNRRELDQSQKRMEKIDIIIQKLYEDNVEGKISDEHFIKMSASYEDEQKSLKARISELECEIATDKENSLNVKHFLDLVKRYTEVSELTAEIIREFIEKVYVYHPEKINGQKTQRVRIVWNCIGEIPAQNKTA